MRGGNVLKFDNPQTCNHCRHCGVIPLPDKTLQKVCKRYPPKLALYPIQTGAGLQWVGNTAFPMLTGDDDCGEFSPKVVG